MNVILSQSPKYATYNLEKSELKSLDVSKIFSPLKVIAHLNMKEDDPIAIESFLSLAKEQHVRKRPYFLALVKDKKNMNLYPFDAIHLEEWLKTKKQNPKTCREISRIFYFSLSLDQQKFSYIGESEKHPEQKKIIQKLFSAITEDPEALYQAGLMYEDKNYDFYNETQAFHFFEQAAIKGLKEALYRLGFCYRYGIYVTQDVSFSLYWFSQAAIFGVKEAQYEFGIALKEGDGIFKDEDLSRVWLKKAADQGHSEAKKVLDLLS